MYATRECGKTHKFGRSYSPMRTSITKFEELISQSSDMLCGIMSMYEFSTRYDMNMNMYFGVWKILFAARTPKIQSLVIFNRIGNVK